MHGVICLQCTNNINNEGSQDNTLFAFCQVCDPERNYRIHTVEQERSEGGETPGKIEYETPGKA